MKHEVRIEDREHKIVTVYRSEGFSSSYHRANVLPDFLEPGCRVYVWDTEHQCEVHQAKRSSEEGG